MSRFGRDADAIRRDLIIALAHPDYRDTATIDALRDLKRRRRKERHDNAGDAECRRERPADPAEEANPLDTSA